MLVLKSPRQLKWSDLKHIEDPFHAKNNLASNLFKPVMGETIVNEGGFNLPQYFSASWDPMSDIKFKLETGQAFLINLTTHFPLLKNIQLQEGEQVSWQFTQQYQHPMIKNALYSVFNGIEKPGNYVATHEDVVHEVQPKQIKAQQEKHRLKIEYEVEKGATPYDTYEVKFSVMNEANKQVCMAQVIDVLKMERGTSSKIFKLNKGDHFSVYPVREHMQDVRKDFSDNKNYQISQANGRIKPLTIDGTDFINGVYLHRTTLKIPPILRMGCFFDGTGNDMSDPVKYSNVQKLSDAYKQAVIGKDYGYQKYIRGVGTEGDSGFDKLMGSIAGFGALDRVAGMLFELEKICKRYIDTYKTYPESIYLDVFGFSRGATTARHFMNVLKQGFYGFNDQAMQTYISPSTIQSSFVGLFDSVGSYGVPGNNSDKGYNFHINDSWLSKQGQVVHLIALNEYRYNFDLQSLFEDQNRHYPEDRVKGKKREIGLIGSHSDVGGSYGPNEQGVVNTSLNPSQLSLMALKKMHALAKEYHVPLAPLEIGSIEAELIEHYDTVENALQRPEIKTCWIQWAGHKKYQSVLQYFLNKYQKMVDAKKIGQPSPYPQGKEVKVAQLEWQLKRSQSSIEHLEQELAGMLGDDFAEFKHSYEYLERYYIHESHGPFNTTPFMGAEKEDGLLGVQQFRRTVYFKKEEYFKYENKKADRVIYKDGRRKVIDIDEFKFVMAKEFH